MNETIQLPSGGEINEKDEKTKDDDVDDKEMSNSNNLLKSPSYVRHKFGENLHHHLSEFNTL